MKNQPCDNYYQSQLWSPHFSFLFQSNSKVNHIQHRVEFRANILQGLDKDTYHCYSQLSISALF